MSSVKLHQVCAPLIGFTSLAAAVTTVIRSIQKPSERTCASQAKGERLLTAGPHRIENGTASCEAFAAAAASLV